MDLRKWKEENSLYHKENLRFYEMLYTAKEDLQFLSEEVVPRNEDIILELGCGTGRLLLPLAKHFREREFVGVDILPECLNICKAKITADPELYNAFHTGRLRLVKGDMSDLSACFSSGEKFGLIILCTSTFLHLQDLEKETLISSIPTLLDKNGIFFLEYTLSFTVNSDWRSSHYEEDNKEYRILRKNEFDASINKAWRFFKFVNIQSGFEQTFQITAHPVDFQRLKEILERNHLEIVEERSSFPLEDPGKRKVLFISRSWGGN